MADIALFDPKITFGNLVEVLVIATGGLFFLWELRTKLTVLQYTHATFDKKLERLDTEFKELSKLTTLIATQHERLNALENRVAEMIAIANSNFQKLDRIQNIITTAGAKSRSKSKIE